MHRIFIFGCSFTQYIWPTWADILEHDNNNVYNYGLSGIGNLGIFHRIIEADLRHKFTKNDSLYILWTTWQREDRFVEGRWRRHGNVYNNSFYKKDFFKYCCDGDFFIKNATSMITINKTYKDIIKFQGHIVSIEPVLAEMSNKFQDLHELYYSEIPNKEVIFTPRRQYNSFDEHPTVIDHLHFLENIVGISVSNNSKMYFNKVHNKLTKMIPKFSEESYSNIHKIWRDQQALGFR